jgi:NitT/TauT family transport system permease protein
MKPSRQQVLTLLLPALVAVFALAAWCWIHLALPENDRFLLPPPDAVWAALIQYRAELARASLNTAQGAVFGFLLAAVISALCAIAMGVSRLVRISFYPYLMVLQMTPIIVFAPMLVLWVGPGLWSVSIITFLICFFPLVTNTTQGLISPDSAHVELFRMYRASRLQELRYLRIPAALPYFFTGLKIAATIAPIGALVGDYTAGSSAGGGGLGFQTLIYSSQARYPALLATAAVTCALGFLLVAMVVGLSWLTLHRWHDSYERKDV